MKQTLSHIPYTPTLLEAYGYSHVLSFGLNSYKYRWTARVAAALGAAEVNRAVGGSFVTSDGVGQMQYQMRQLTPRRQTTAPYTLSESDLVFVSAGVAELAYVGPSTYQAIAAGVRSMIGWAKAGAVFQAQPAGGSHSSFTWGSGWLDIASRILSNSGSGYRATLTNNSNFQIAVPPEFPGGDIYIGMVLLPYSGAVMGTQVIGSTSKSQSFDFTNPYLIANYKYNGTIARITNLNAGAHTINATITSVVGFGIGIDHWAIPANPSPRVALLRQAKLSATGRAFAFGSSSLYTDAQADVLNTTLLEVANEWTDGTVKFIEYVKDVEKNPYYLFPGDGVHHNEAGEAKIAENILNYLSSSWSGPEQEINQVYPGLSEFSSAMTYSNSWADATVFSSDSYQSGAFSVRKDNTIKLSGKVRKSSGTPSFGETIITIPYNRFPIKRHSYLCGATPGKIATLEVRPDGTVVYVNGSINTGGCVDLNAIEFSINQ